MLNFTESCKFILKPTHFFTQNVGTRIYHAIERASQLVTQRSVLITEVDKRDLNG
jgi:hypothetical protein